MLATLSVALQRFRRRLRLCALLAGASLAATWLAGSAAAVLVGLQLVARELPVWLTATWHGPAMAAAAVLVAAGAWGWWRAVCTGVDDAQLCEHLEQRLGTHGLLLVAGEGVALPEPFAQQLAVQLQRADAVLPQIEVAARVWRPALALLLLLGVLLLPAPATHGGGGTAAVAAVGKLAERVEELAADARVPGDAREELHAAVQELERRAADGEDNLWREIDQLTARVDREVAGLAGADAGRGEPGSAEGGEVAEVSRQQRVAQLAAAAQLLQQASPDAIERLPGEVQELLRAARDEPGTIDAARLAADARWTPELAAHSATALAAALEALAATASVSPELAAQARQLAAGLAQATPPLAGEVAPTLAPGQRQDLMQAVAEGASALAELSESFDGLAARLQDALGSGAAELAARALESVDIAALLELLPEDPQQLLALAERLGELAGEAAQSASSSAPTSSEPLSSPSAGEAAAAAQRGLSAEQQARLQQLAQRLAAAAGAGRQTSEQRGRGPAGSNQSGVGPGAAAPGSAAAGTTAGSGAPGRGPGHSALRMTERAGGEATGELELPTPLDPQQLSREWRPLQVQKALPEVGAPHAAAPGGRPAADGSGAATWRLRVMPRHRAVVQRFFDSGDAATPTTGDRRGGDKR